MNLRPAMLFLDEAGHIYLPLLGPAESCMRLNSHASKLWRSWTSSALDRTTLPPLEKIFLDDLLEKGALREATTAEYAELDEPITRAPEVQP